MDPKTLDEKVSSLVVGLPRELSSAVREKFAFYKTKQPVFSPEEIYREVRSLVRLEMLAYLDRREYLGMYNRRYAEHKLSEHIREIVKRPAMGEVDLYGLARVNLDLNGLKALNDLGGHEAGNKGLKLFANILNFGATTLWLRDELGLVVTTSAEGGDEFGIIIAGNVDLREHLPAIKHGYVEEVYKADASHFLDFSKPEIREKLAMLGIAEDVPPDFTFRLSTSIGVCLFGETFDQVEVSRSEASFRDVEQKVINAMFALADKRSLLHKSEFKRELRDTSPILSGLYARMSREVIHIEKELRERDRRILELEQKLKDK